MDRGPIRIKKKKGSRDWVSFDPRLSNDRKTLVVNVESSTKFNWYEYMNALASYALEELDRLNSVTSDVQH
jgi:hypothetical protein